MSNGISFESNSGEVAAALVAQSVRAGARAFAITRHHGTLLLTRIRRNASLPRSGPPGPRLITGAYVRSWSLTTSLEGVDPAATAGTNAPQARRLEFGFNDTDSLGRRYNQPPYPHVAPAFDETVPGFIAALEAVTDA
jgi:hypothetical protein